MKTFLLLKLQMVKNVIGEDVNIVKEVTIIGHIIYHQKKFIMN